MSAEILPEQKSCNFTFIDDVCVTTEETYKYLEERRIKINDFAYGGYGKGKL